MDAQGPMPSDVVEAGRSYGYTDAELQRIRDGEVLSKPLKEGSDKELAGVVAVMFSTSVEEFADFLLEGKTLQSDPAIRSLHVWKPGESPERVFADLMLDAED